MACFNGDFSARPQINITVNGQTKSWLSNTGASRTRINLAPFKSIFPQGVPCPIKSEHGNDNLHSACGTSLGLHGIFYLQLKIMNRTIFHEVYVCKQVTDRIIGINFIQKHNLQFDTRRRQVYWDKPKPESVISVTSEICFLAHQTIVLNSSFHSALNDNACYIATVFSLDSSILMGGPAMVSIHSNLKCAIAVTKTAPFNIYLQRGAIIGLIETEVKANNITPLSSESVKSIISSIAPVKIKSENLTQAYIEQKLT